MGKDDHPPSTKRHYGSLLKAAASEDLLEDVVQLLEDENTPKAYYKDALEAASKKGHRKIVELLLDIGANANPKGLLTSPLHAASSGGQEEIVQLLLDKGADIDYRSPFHSALAIASSKSHYGVVKLLLDKGAVVNDNKCDHCPALIYASLKGYEDIVNLLVKNGAIANNLALDFALSKESHKGISDLFQGKIAREATLD